MSLKDITRNRWVKLGFWALLYTAWVIWLGNYWWLFGLIIILRSTMCGSTGSTRSSSRWLW